MTIHPKVTIHPNKTQKSHGLRMQVSCNYALCQRNYGHEDTDHNLPWSKSGPHDWLERRSSVISTYTNSISNTRTERLLKLTGTLKLYQKQETIGITCNAISALHAITIQPTVAQPPKPQPLQHAAGPNGRCLQLSSPLLLLFRRLSDNTGRRRVK